MVTAFEVAILACILAKISVELGQIITRIAIKSYLNIKKCVFNIRPLITQIARYYKVDIKGDDLTIISEHIVPVDLIILGNMKMLTLPQPNV